MPLFAHRENHGEGCGFTVKLKATDTNFEENVEVLELSQFKLVEFADQYVRDNVSEDSVLFGLIPLDSVLDFLASSVQDPRSEMRRSFILDAQLYFEENWDKFFPAVAEVA